MKTENKNESVVDYRRMVTSMLADLRQVRDYCQRLELTDTVIRVNEVIARKEKEFFSVAVIGEFKRGKSTLINALLGKEILPADVLPCSATLNRITFGLKPEVKIIYKANEQSSEVIETIKVEELSDYVTKLTPESEKTAQDVKEAIVYYPIKYCRDNADIIDTPGLNDDQTMTDITLSVLQKVDAAILVISATSPFSEYEGEFLTNRIFTQDLARVIFVVNRIDDIKKIEDRERIIKQIENRIQKVVEQRASELFGQDSEEYKMFLKRIGKPTAFGISAEQALQAKLSDDPDKLQSSGFIKFEEKLERFLTHDRGAASTQVLADSTVYACSQVSRTIKIKDSALKMEKEEFEKIYGETSKKLQDLRNRQKEELLKVDIASEKALNSTGNLLSIFFDDLRTSTTQTIEEFVVKPEDLDKNLESTKGKLTTKVESQLRTTIQKSMEKLQLAIELEISKEVLRLGDFALEVSDTLKQIELKFIAVHADDKAKTNSAAEGVLATVPIVGGLLFSNLGFGLSGIWAGYREAGVKGALVGGAAGALTGAATLVTTGIGAALLGLPFAWPVVLTVGVTGALASFFGGQWATKKFFSKERVETFKNNFKEEVLEQLNKTFAVKKEEIHGSLRKQIQDAFTAIKEIIVKELGAPIDETQTNLDDLRRRIARADALLETELQELNDIADKTNEIQIRASQKSLELRDITSV